MHIDTFHSLAAPTRRRILKVLLDGEMAVNDIVETVAIRQSGVSRHLRILHDASFVEVRADGQKWLYSLRPDPFREIDAWVTHYRRMWEARLDRFVVALGRRQHANKPRRKERAS